MTTTPDSYTWDASWVDQLVYDSSLPPPRQIPACRPRTPTPRSSPVFFPTSSFYGTNNTSTPPSDLSLADANISFGPVPPPNTPAETHGSLASSAPLLPQPCGTEEHAEPDSFAERQSKLKDTSKPRFTREPRGVEPKVLLERLRTVASEHEDGLDMVQDAVKEQTFETQSWFTDDERDFCTRVISFKDGDLGGLARAINDESPLQQMASLQINAVKSGVIERARSPTAEGQVQAQAAVVCYSEPVVIPESLPEAAMISAPLPSEAKSCHNIGSVRQKMTSLMSRILHRAGAIRSRSNPQCTGRQPNHAKLVPGKSCFKPGRSQASAPLDVTEEEADNDLHIEVVPAPKPDEPEEGGKTVTFAPEPVAKRRSKVACKVAKCKRRLAREAKNAAGDWEPDSPINEASPFASQDKETYRMIQKAVDYRNANERAAVLRGALDFLITVTDRVDTVASQRVSNILARLGDKSIGSYTGDEKNYANARQDANRVPLSMYRSRETAMSYKSRLSFA
ncbi:hypothetical protein FBEOM_1970 [Fusarium beomiforme]|uniref:Uncharacterized protein n=1 Tax=Fusarium beomiforme TaxID=44412 RepID=A0A9P5E4C2_9HYPO|nr:hypothetical protein FBEOM_1970 [Fusarium beomiforme]